MSRVKRARIRSNGITEKEAENLTGRCKKLPLSMHMRGRLSRLKRAARRASWRWGGKNKGDWKGWGKEGVGFSP